MKNIKLKGGLLYKAVVIYASYFTFLPVINPESGHWRNVLMSLFVAVAITLGVYFFSSGKKDNVKNYDSEQM